MSEVADLKEEIVFTCGFFGDGFDVYRLSSPNAEPTFVVRWRGSIGAGLTDEFWDDLNEHMDDDDEEFAKWEATVTDPNPPPPPPDPDPSPSFDEALDRASIGTQILSGHPVFILDDIRNELRIHVQRLISGLMEDERDSFGERRLTTADDWFAREWPAQDDEN